MIIEEHDRRRRRERRFLDLSIVLFGREECVTDYHRRAVP